MLTCLKADLRRLPILIFVLLLFSLCACTAGNTDTAVENETTVSTGSEEKPHLGNLKRVPLEHGEALSTVLEGTVGELDAASQTQTEQEIAIPVEWLSQGWNGVEISESCQTNNYNLPRINFPDTSICELHNFKLFLDKFSEDANFQISATKFPLKRTRIFPEYLKEEERLILMEEVRCYDLPKNLNTFYVFPIKEQRERENLYFSHTVEDHIATVRLGKEDTGVSINFIFSWNQCWMLSEIKNYSM